MLQLVPILAIALFAAFGAAGYIVVQQNRQIESLSSQIKSLQITPTASPSPITTPIVEPTPTPTLKPYIKPTYAPGEAPAIEPDSKQKALIEIENKMAAIKQQIQEYMKAIESYKGTRFEGSSYEHLVYGFIDDLNKQYQELEKSRWQIMSQP